MTKFDEVRGQNSQENALYLEVCQRKQHTKTKIKHTILSIAIMKIKLVTTNNKNLNPEINSSLVHINTLSPKILLKHLFFKIHIHLPLYTYTNYFTFKYIFSWVSE